MAEIASGVYQLKVPIPNNPLENTNIYLVQGDSEYLLIDAGWNNQQALRSLSDQLTEIGVSFKDISQIVVTHAHFDHYGLAGRLKELSQATIALHSLDKDLLSTRYLVTDEYLRQTEQWFYVNGVPADELPTSRTMFAGMRQPGAPTPPDIILQDGETISVGSFNLQVVWTPGHSPGHICLYEPARKIFFSGDHILPIITPNISLQPQSTANPLSDFLNSLNLVKQFDADLVLPAHEHPFNDLGKRADEIILHHELRNMEILEAMKTEPKTAYQVSTHITWMPELGGVRFRDLAPGDKRMAVSETLAHLKAMRVNNRVSTISRDDITYYQRT